MTLNHWMRWYDFSVVRKERAQAKLMLCFLFQVRTEGASVSNGRVHASAARGSHKFYYNCLGRWHRVAGF